MATCNKTVQIGDNNFIFCYDELGHVLAIYDEDQININTEIVNNYNSSNTYIINEAGDTITNVEITEVINEYITHGSNSITNNMPSYTTVINGQEVTVVLDRFGANYYNASSIKPIAKSHLTEDTDYEYDNLPLAGRPNDGWFFIPTSFYKDNNGKNRIDWLKPHSLTLGDKTCLGIQTQKKGWYHLSLKGEILLTGAINAIRMILFYLPPAGSTKDLTPIPIDVKFGQADEASLDTIGTDHDLDSGKYYPFNGSGKFELEKGATVFLGGRVAPLVDIPNDDIDDANDHTHSGDTGNYTDPDGELEVPEKGYFRVRSAGLVSGVGSGGTGTGNISQNPESGTGFTIAWDTDMNGQMNYQSAE